MQSPVTPGLATAARAMLGTGLAHTYTRSPFAEVAADLWARRDRTAGPGAVVTGVTCRYVERTSVVQGPDGYITTTTPPASGGSVTFIQTLTVAWDDPLTVGDGVSDIRDADGVVLLVGPAVVQADLAHAGFGPTTLRMLVLRGVTEERAP